MNSYKNLKKGTKIGLWIVTILTCLGMINFILSLCVSENRTEPDVLGHLIMDGVMFILIGTYAFFGFKKPHGNILRLTLLLLGAFIFINSVLPIPGMKETKAIIYRLLAGASTLLTGYFAGRLDRIKQNIVLMIAIGIFLLIGQLIVIYAFPSNFIRVFGVLTPVVMWADICLAYVVRYEEHKAAGIEE